MNSHRFVVSTGLSLLSLFAFGCSSVGKSNSRPELVSRAEWNANAPVAEMKTQEPKFITIHHTATKQKPAVSLEEKLRNLQKFSQNEGALAGGRKKPVWADVPYHFYISVDGRIGEGRDARFVGDTNTEYDPTGHLLVTLEGNFEEEEPTEAQMASARRLIRWLAARNKIHSNQIATHKDYARTACPGKNLHDRMSALRPVSSKR